MVLVAVTLLEYSRVMAKKNDPVAAARRAFVQQRVAKTGRSDAESKAKFRAKFESLSQTKEGRQQIASVTNIAGIRKILATSQKGKSTGSKKVTPSYGLTPADRPNSTVQRPSSYVAPVSAAEKQAALDKMVAQNPAWGGPLNQFGMPASARQQRLDMVQNYNELNADAPGWASGGPSGEDIKNWLSRNLKFWD